jgi:pimeloyl-ACP methyl ester carboxylesterase
VSSLKISLINIPVVFIHGYQASGYIFDNLRDYLTDRNIKGSAITYKSENGIVSASNELSAFLSRQQQTYLFQGFQVKKFNIIAHSMGGLVTRYYSCSNDNLKNNNIEKIIFLAVPHKGSPWASIGLNQYNDQGIRDMIPDEYFLSNILPSMFNKGLNSSIQTANIAVEYDEVVDQDSASLDDWGIKAEVFNVGGNNFSVNNLLNGNLAQAINHKSVLSNKKVFERVFEMLSTQLEYPKKIR